MFRRTDTRCFWFKDDGTTYKRREGGWGCIDDFCEYIHPCHKEWPTAQSSRPPFAALLATSELRNLGWMPAYGHRLRGSPSPERMGDARGRSRSRTRGRAKRLIVESEEEDDSAGSQNEEGASLESQTHPVRSLNRNLTQVLPMKVSPTLPTGPRAALPSPTVPSKLPQTIAAPPRAAVVKTIDPRKRTERKDSANTTEAINLIGHLRIADPRTSSRPATLPTANITRRVAPPPSLTTTTVKMSTNTTPLAEKAAHISTVPASPSSDTKPRIQPSQIKLTIPPPDTPSATTMPTDDQKPLISPLEPPTSATSSIMLPPNLPSRSPTTPRRKTSDQVPPSPSTSEASISLHSDTKVWAERINALASALSAHQKWTTIKENLKRYDDIMSSPLGSCASEEDKTRFTREIKSLQEASSNEKQTLKQALVKLVTTGLWQLDTERVPPAAVAVSTAKNDELLGQIAGLRTMLLGLHGTTTALGTKLNVPVPPLSMSKGATTSERDVDGDSSLPPKKRRRISSPGVGDGDIRMEDVDSAAAGVMSLKDIQELAETLQGQVQALQTRSDKKAEEVEVSVKRQLEAKVEELRGGVSLHAKKVGEDADARDVRIKRTQVDNDQTGKEIEEMAQEIAGLMEQSGGLGSENQRLATANEELQSENERLRAEVETMKQQLVSVQESSKQQMDTMKKQIDELDSKLTTYLTQPPPTLDHMEFLNSFMIAMRPIMLDQLRLQLTPMLLDIRTTVEDMLRAQNSEIANTVLTKLQMTLQMMEALSSWAGHLKPDPDTANPRMRGATS